MKLIPCGNVEIKYMSAANTKIISIYNGFPFHFEIFGVFLNFLHEFRQRSGGAVDLRVRIYTNMDDSLHWLDFFRARYISNPSDVWVEILPHTDFSDAVFIESTYVILGTDDDESFSPHYASLPGASKKLICYDHDITLRSPHIQRHITTRPYPPQVTHRVGVPYMYPVYPMINLETKRAALAEETTVNIIVVGGSYNHNRYWPYLLRTNAEAFRDGRIRIFYIHRHCPGVWRRMDKYVASICPQTEIIEDCDTARMYSLLRRSHYMLILTDVDKFIHLSCSGSIGLAFSMGCPLIMPRAYNTDYQFRSAMYFEDLPILTTTPPTLETVFEEQAAIHAHNTELLSSTMTLDP
jgi:hypothetical protein